VTGFAFSILEHSAGISWPPPAQPLVAEAELVAAGAAPDGPSGALAAVVAGPVEGAAAQPFGAAAARPFEAAEALALPSAGPDATVVRPHVAARPVAFEASARPAARVLEVLQSVWVVAVAAEPRLAFAPFPERPVWLPGLEPHRQPSVGPPEILAHWPAADLAGQVSRWGLGHLERVPSRLGVQEVSPSRPGPAMHWPSATLVPEAAHWGKRLRAMACLAQPSDRMACRECPTWLPD
jgi:hypothetical protein